MSQEDEDRDAIDRRSRQLVKDLPEPMPRARTTAEMVFAASLVACPYCHTTEPAALDLIGSGTSWSLTGACIRCGARRSHAWQTEGHPVHGARPMRQLGDERPSQIIRVGQFMGELDRLLPLVVEPAQLEPTQWRAVLAASERALTCLFELLKFVPASMDAIPDTGLTDAERRDHAARPERYRKTWLQGELDHLLAVRGRYGEDAPRIWALEQRDETPSRGAIDRQSLMAHQAWVRNGRRGDGRLDVVGVSAHGLRLGGALCEGAYLERVIFDGALLGGARMTDCELRDVSFLDANCTSLDLTRARIVGGTFARCALALAVLVDATIEGTSFADANLDRSQWRGAVTTGACFDHATFGNSWLDGGCFRGCTFVQADFRRLTAGIRATTAGARFEDCDLRGTRWEDRDLTGATFVRCKLASIVGRPSSVVNVTIEDPDLSPDGDGSAIATAADVMERWRVPC
jgi:uncharacterized protein YjbI with pentapeptide repeats